MRNVCFLHFAHFKHLHLVFRRFRLRISTLFVRIASDLGAHLRHLTEFHMVKRFIGAISSIAMGELHLYRRPLVLIDRCISWSCSGLFVRSLQVSIKSHRIFKSRSLHLWYIIAIVQILPHNLRSYRLFPL